MYKNYRPIHSDFIVHWTGRDIDQAEDPKWNETHSVKTNRHVTHLYLDRLKSILKFGLWMTTDEEESYIKYNNNTYKRPLVARTCFTELKLSEVRNHAANYGRLGIGFKRLFIFNRLGGPMSYYMGGRDNWFLLPFLDHGNCRANEVFTNFLKPMAKRSEDGTLEYKFYDESEWRIVYSHDIENYLVEHELDKICNYFVKAEKVPGFNEYITSCGLETKPDYILPIRSKWFSMIIYPSLGCKVEAEADQEIRSLINSIKCTKQPNSDYTELAGAEKHSKPIEINLDSCRHF